MAQSYISSKKKTYEVANGFTSPDVMPAKSFKILVKYKCSKPQMIPVVQLLSPALTLMQQNTSVQTLSSMLDPVRRCQIKIQIFDKSVIILYIEILSLQ